MAFMSMGILSVIMWIAIILLLLILVGTFVLQVFLSKMERPWIGLILPGLSFFFVLILCFYTPDFYTFMLMLIKGNIGTVIYLLIYFIVRRRKKKRDNLSQMKIKDL